MIARIRRYLSVGAPHWAVRRRIVVGLVLVAVAIIIQQAGWEHDTVKARDTIGAMVQLIEWVLITYVGAATTEDVMARMRSAAPGTPPAAPAGAR